MENPLRQNFFRAGNAHAGRDCDSFPCLFRCLRMPRLLPSPLIWLVRISMRFR